MLFLDADDCWAKNALTIKTVAAFDSTDCIGFASVHCTEDLSRSDVCAKLKERIVSGGVSALQSHSAFHFGAMVYSTQLLRRYRIRFIEELKYSEDLLFRFTCLYLADKIRFVNQVLYLYRHNTSGAMRTRKYGINYMPSIIEGYLKTEEFLAPYENSNRGSIAFFHVMPGVYALEMAGEHYQELGTKAELDRFFWNNPQFVSLINELKETDLSDNHRDLRNKFLNKPKRFRCENYFKGIIRSCFHLAQRNPLFSGMMIKRRYPQKNGYL